MGNKKLLSEKRRQSMYSSWPGQTKLFKINQEIWLEYTGLIMQCTFNGLIAAVIGSDGKARCHPCAFEKQFGCSLTGDITEELHKPVVV